MRRSMLGARGKKGKKKRKRSAERISRMLLQNRKGKGKPRRERPFGGVTLTIFEQKGKKGNPSRCREKRKKLEWPLEERKSSSIEAGGGKGRLRAGIEGGERLFTLLKKEKGGYARGKKSMLPFTSLRRGDYLWGEEAKR